MNRTLTRRDALRGLLALGLVAPTAALFPAAQRAAAQGWPPLWFLDDQSIRGRLRREALGLWLFEDSTNLGDDASRRGNRLTNTNSVTQVAGTVGQAAHFVAASSQYLTRNAATTLSGRGLGSFTFAGWLRCTDVAGTYGVLGQGSAATAGGLSYRLRLQTGPAQLHWLISDGSATTDLTHPTFGALSAATWYFVVVQYDAVAKLMGISFNGGAFETTSQTTGAQTLQQPFYLGANVPGVTFLNGDLDNWLRLNRLLTATELRWLAGGGSLR